MPAFLVAILRGNVGTDSFFYLGLFEDYKLYGESYARYEPGFEILGKVLMGAGFSPRAGVAMVAVITTFILCHVFSKTKNQFMVFSLLLFPLFYYDFTMNGIRYGLSFSIMSVAVINLYKKNYKLFALLVILSLSMQYSSVLVLIPFVSVLVKKKYIILTGVLLGVLIAAFPSFFSIITDRIAEKRDAYSEIFAPSLFSGILPLLIVLAIYLNYLRHNKGQKISRVIHIIFLCELASFIFAKFSYAGLRFQGAFMFSMLIFLRNNSESIVKVKQFTVNLVLISIIGMLLFVKNITTVVQDELTPFLPYKFYWEEKNHSSL